ncbi:RNA polymerase III transcription factor-like protein TFIIIC subunit Tfc4 [Mollisia scopiformis]|uniref:RNA polymerase III transcription factor-like protein TFIIIC subunit Tfc4 n=1 Tax=Mollisia scopiformis TaxID=149040 RepID=A0A194WYB6_MOLSC|nr:RNA polymerase III transcription factor-like protein TFIIIC subunit Tfc4 [Mollisia scopiformis]KUJ12679.1 RNA polymerase III transcription factor-like protein TFIIIC subunit Tfc4 [Mollisia scopiformis]
MWRPLPLNPPGPSAQKIPSDPRFSQSQIPVWNHQQPTPAASQYNFGHDRSSISQSQHLAPEFSKVMHYPDLDIERAGFEVASTHGRHIQRAEALADVDIGKSSQDEFEPDEDDDLSDSDADDDVREFEASLASLQNGDELLKRLAAPESSELDFSKLLAGNSLSRGSIKRSRQRVGRTKIFRRHRGPRKAAEPTPDIKLRISRANDLYINKRFDEAVTELEEIIRINAETPQAWETLASIRNDRGDSEHAALCFHMAATFRPKIISGWLTCIDYCLRIQGPKRPRAIAFAQNACATMVRHMPNDLEARMKKAEVFIENGKLQRAISEYKWILKRDRMRKPALQKLAEVCVDVGDVHTAIQEYKNSLLQFRAPDNDSEVVFGWEDADAYITLHEVARQYYTAISELKSLARWLLGREEESFWDDVVGDDREWDINDLRRLQVPDFTQGKYDPSTYGLGLPYEFRVKLGLYRLHLGQHPEAMAHLNVLQGPDQDDTLADDYSYLFRQAADQLYRAGLHQAAMSFYQPLTRVPAVVDSPLLVQIGRCFLKVSDDLKAAESFKAAINLDAGDVDARMELARMYERTQQPEKAFDYVTEIIQVKKNLRPETKRQKQKVADMDKGVEMGSDANSAIVSRAASKEYTPRSVHTSASRIQKDELIQTAELLQTQYQILKSEQNGMRTGDVTSSLLWRDAARALTDDFRSFKTFYPWDKYIRFLGYSGHVRLQAETSLDSDLTAMAERLSKNLGADISTKTNLPSVEIPEDYRGISFRKWLDIFLDYALCLARDGQAKASYEICEAAKDAIVFCHSREDMFLIQLCWCTCALIASDEETCVSVVRFFMKDYQFTTDSYRMFAAVSRACHSPVSWYNSGPTQKFILRQIKLMDYSLVSEDKRRRHYADKGSYSAQDSKGHIIINSDMDVALLMLYGHILFTGGSYPYALNYFFRAYALDPSNPMINLNIGLACIHHALKRQTENRQYSIIQGLSFMMVYYQLRLQCPRSEERQEAHYNMARVYHMLGLVHLAIPFYQKVFDEISGVPEQPTHEKLVLDTAYNLQAIYSMSGNTELAEEVTRRWLVI